MSKHWVSGRRRKKREKTCRRSLDHSTGFWGETPGSGSKHWDLGRNTGFWGKTLGSGSKHWDLCQNTGFWVEIDWVLGRYTACPGGWVGTLRVRVEGSKKEMGKKNKNEGRRRNKPAPTPFGAHQLCTERISIKQHCRVELVEQTKIVRAVRGGPVLKQKRLRPQSSIKSLDAGPQTAKNSRTFFSRFRKVPTSWRLNSART